MMFGLAEIPKYRIMQPALDTLPITEGKYSNVFAARHVLPNSTRRLYV